MNPKKTPHEIAAAFGCTPEQARTHMLANAAQLEQMAARAADKYRGFTRQQLSEHAIRVNAVADPADHLRDAAPDMLACLQWFMAQMRDDGAIDMCKLIDEMERRASAAIAKATQ